MERDCPACKGIGWQRVDVPITHPNFGKLYPCELCGQGRREAWLRELCRLSPEMQDWKLYGFHEGPSTTGVVAKLRQAIESKKGWVIISGPPGTGKTYLLAAAINKARELTMPAVYITMAELLSDLRDTFHPSSGQGFSSLFSSILGAQLLCLDEIEKFRATPWAEEQIFRLFETRYREWDQGLTILATNRRIGTQEPIFEQTAYPGYIESRIMDGRFTRLEFWEAADARPALK